jgi:hypothetical protein
MRVKASAVFVRGGAGGSRDSLGARKLASALEGAAFAAVVSGLDAVKAAASLPAQASRRTP